MDDTYERAVHLRLRAARIAGVLGIGALFVMVAVIADPLASKADPAGDRASGGDGGVGVMIQPRAVEALPLRDERGRPLLGELVGSEYLVRIFGSEDEPRYTVCTLGGTVLADDLFADEVYREFPDLDIPSLQFGQDDAIGALMMADPD